MSPSMLVRFSVSLSNASSRAVRADSGRRSVFDQFTSPKTPSSLPGFASWMRSSVLPSFEPTFDAVSITSSQWQPPGMTNG